MQYIEDIEPSISRDMWSELDLAAEAINTFDPWIEGKDCIVLREVHIA
jgi:hypothetical protein